MWHRSGEFGELVRRARGIYGYRKYHLFAWPTWFRNTFIIAGSLILVYLLLLALVPEWMIAGVRVETARTWGIYVDVWFLVLIAIVAAVLIVRKTRRR